MNRTINFCFLYGKIITEIDLNFFYNSKWHNSQVEFKIEINYKYSTKKKLGKQIVFLKAYDDMADVIYRYYKAGYYIKIIGIVTSECIEVDKII